jgi:hypothetical protein
MFPCEIQQKSLSHRGNIFATQSLCAPVC